MEKEGKVADREPLMGDPFIYLLGTSFKERKNLYDTDRCGQCAGRERLLKHTGFRNSQLAVVKEGTLPLLSLIFGSVPSFPRIQSVNPYLFISDGQFLVTNRATNRHSSLFAI
jgi:hypothetical protein